MNANAPTDKPGESSGPTLPSWLTVKFHKQPNGLLIQFPRPGGPWIFLLLFLIFWAVGCVSLLGKMIANPSFGLFQFALPFWTCWLAIVCALVWMLFGKETFAIDRKTGSFQRTAFIPLLSRIVPRNEIQRFRECPSLHQENHKHLWGIEMVTLGKPLRFGFRLPDRERHWLIEQLNHFLKRAGIGANSQQCRLEKKHSLAQMTPLRTEVLSFDATLAIPPTDCRWHCAEEANCLEFWQQGRGHKITLMFLLFLNLFWNGILSLFVVMLFAQLPIGQPPLGWKWWSVVVFMIPHVAFGLLFALLLILALLKPFFRLSWRFERDLIIKRVSWPLFTRKKSWDIVPFYRLELRYTDYLQPTGPIDLESKIEYVIPSPYSLVLVSRAIGDLCAIHNLTEGEARWMGRILLEQRGMWFGN